jgi:2-dehydropantoate 2-reductase
MFGRLAAEVARVAAAEGVRCETIDGFDPTAFRLDSSGDPAAIEACWEGQRRYWGRHPGGRTGVWRDLAQHRRKTEVGEQVGAVVGRARRHAVPVPRLEKLAAMIAEAEEGRRGLVYANLDELVAFDRAEMANRRASASPR